MLWENVNSLIQYLRLGLPYPLVVYQERKVKTILIYRNINVFIWNLIMVVCMGERERVRHSTAMTEVMWRQTYSQPYFLLLNGSLDTESVLCQGATWLLYSWPVYLLAALRKTDHLTLWGWKSLIPYFLDTHTFFLFTQFMWFISAVPYLL